MPKKAPTRKTAAKIVSKKIGSKKKPKKNLDLDLTGFPPESLVTSSIAICLACALDVLTRHMGLKPERAQLEIRRHTPTLAELLTPEPTRPYMAPADECPNCGAPPKWHAPLKILRIEGGKTTDVLRRPLVKTIGESPNFTVIEQKSTEREALYSWLSKIGADLDLDSPEWLLDAARHWLGRRLPKQDWSETFRQIRFVRRSRRLDDGFEIEGSRLFLAPALLDEIC